MHGRYRNCAGTAECRHQGHAVRPFNPSSDSSPFTGGFAPPVTPLQSSSRNPASTPQTGHVPEIAGHDAETGGHVGPKYAPMRVNDRVRCAAVWLAVRDRCYSAERVRQRSALPACARRTPPIQTLASVRAKHEGLPCVPSQASRPIPWRSPVTWRPTKEIGASCKTRLSP